MAHLQNKKWVYWLIKNSISIFQKYYTLKINNTDKLHSVQLLKRLFFQNDFDKGVLNWYNDYNKAVVNPLLAKVIICQKLATMSPKTWIGSKYGFYYASSKEDSYVGYV